MDQIEPPTQGKQRQMSENPMEEEEEYRWIEEAEQESGLGGGGQSRKSRICGARWQFRG